MVEGKLEIYRQVEERNYFQLSFRGRDLHLMAGPYVGLIPICPGITINVQPRLPVSNLARVIDIAQKKLGVIDRVDRHYAWYDRATDSVLEFLVRSLLAALQPIEVHGLDRAYVRTNVTSANPRGRIDIKASYTRLVPRGIRHKVVSSRFEQTTDTPANQVIKAALWLAALKLQNAPRPQDVMSEMNRAILRFDSVSLDVDKAMTLARRDVELSTLTARTYYAEALRIASAILSEKGLSLDTVRSDFEFSSFILNLEDVFEAYLRAVLADGLSRSAKGPFVVGDGNHAPASKPLFDDRPDPPAQPDIVISAAGQCVAVCEVKYKKSTTREDLNQLIAYASRYRAGVAVLIHLAPQNQQVALIRRGRIQSTDYYAFGFDLSASPLEAKEKDFVAAIERLIPSALPLANAV